MKTAHVGQKVKYANPDAYPGYKKPDEITVGSIYTIGSISERGRDHKLAGDMTFELEERPGSVYGAKRFEPAPSNAKTIHRGYNL